MMYHTMEFATFVTLRSTLRVLGLAGAELAEVLCCSGYGIGEEMDLYSAEWFACKFDSAWVEVLIER